MFSLSLRYYTSGDETSLPVRVYALPAFIEITRPALAWISYIIRMSCE
jgi:hypothetical protein